ncbi:hypothetical protein FRB96_005003 [Tulasnella sp. 330]|nr:hypothetical protein FRB96_005003 [Tulasnella sp. 330]KAG8890280.1 hypothetical protein FRB98_000191 [Tulasnella sp. 332]
MKCFDLDKGKVPVVVAFTKYDALGLKALGQLERSGCTDEAAGPKEEEEEEEEEEKTMSAPAKKLFQERSLKTCHGITTSTSCIHIRLKGMIYVLFF